MRSKNYLQSKMHYFGIVGLVLLLTSCGSYQYAGYEDDAIYGGSEREYTERVVSDDVYQNDDNGYYKNYFKEKALQYEAVNESDAIFTDIDSYEGSYGVENDTIRYTEGYAGWGQDHNQDVTVNVYGGHMYNSIWWNRPVGWGIGWNYGWNNWGFNNYWGWGWNNWGWNVGFGWNYWDPFWCPPYYGYGGYWAGNPWIYGGGYYYGSPYYGYYGRRVAYNASRRSPIYSRNGIASVNRRSSVNSFNSRRSSVNNTAVRPNSRIRPDATRTRPTSSRTRPAINGDSRVRPSSGVRPNTRPAVRPDGKPRTRPTARPNNGRTKPVMRTRPNNNNRKSNYNTRSRSNNRSSGYSRPSSSRSSSYSRPSSSRSSSISRSGGSSRSSGSRSGGSRRGGRM